VQTKNNETLETCPVSTQAVREYLAHVWKIYQGSLRGEKAKILDELARNLGIHRKSATRLMNRPYAPRSLQGSTGGRKAKYSKQAKELVRRLWKIMGYMAPVRMKAAIPEWLPFFESTEFDDLTRAEVMAMSSSTIGRVLLQERAQLRRKMNTGTFRGVRKFITEVPLRNLDESPTEVGHCEIDCVAHCGGSLSGSFAWTLNLTDIVTGWTECEAIWSKDGASVRRALTAMRNRLPFALKALYCDNGSEFLNRDVVEIFIKKDCQGSVQLFRGRPYRKNDQCYVEQKNYTHVRNLFGYGRIDWCGAVRLMNDLYRKEWRHLQNFFMPQQKLVEKQRINSQVKRRMDTPKTPFDRLLPFLTIKAVVKLTDEKSNWNPIQCRTKQLRKVRSIFGHFKDKFGTNFWGKMAI